MRKTMLMIVALGLAMPAAHAAGVFDWLKAPHVGGPKEKASADAAELLTLEPHQTEMYPKPSPDGRFLLTVVHDRKKTWISRRYAENGDPANRITEDARAFDSAAWKDAGHVYFFSERAGGLGLWEKISDGEGMLRRVAALHGRLTQPVLLPDGAVIAVRLQPVGGEKLASRRHHRTDGFDNWSFPGFRAEIVRVEKNGSERVLSEGVNPALSPDGKWIAFSMPVGRSIHLFRMHPDGSELIQVTSARSVDVQPSWSTDGKWLLFTSNRAHADLRRRGKSDWDIWAIDTTGRNLIQVTYDEDRDGAARMGKNGRVYFHSDRSVSKKMREKHQVKGSTSGFHIWTIAWPEQAR